MARCPYLDYESSGPFVSQGCYICKACGRQMDFDSTQVKHTCNPDYGENYKDCSVYRSHR